MGLPSVLAVAQDAPWCRSFLAPVLDELAGLPSGSRVLDLGTGPGKLLELMEEGLDLLGTGADVDQSMLDTARARTLLARTPLIHVERGGPLPFSAGEFDAVCLCSVLFNLGDPEPLLSEALRVTDPYGIVVVYTPTGGGTPGDALSKLPPRSRGRVRNGTLFVWHRATASAGRRWTTAGHLERYAHTHGLTYTGRTAFHGMATVEVLRRGHSRE